MLMPLYAVFSAFEPCRYEIHVFFQRHMRHVGVNNNRRQYVRLPLAALIFSLMLIFFLRAASHAMRRCLTPMLSSLPL